IAAIGDLAARRPAGASRDSLLLVLRTRIARLDALPADRVPESDFPAIARAGLAALAAGIPCRTVDALLARMEIAAQAPPSGGAPVRHTALPALLDRLRPEGAPRWRPSESIMSVEYERRELASLLQGELDRARYLAVANTLDAILDDGEALLAPGPGGTLPAFL